MDYAHPEMLIDCQALHQQLEAPQLRIFDCAVFLTPSGNGQYQIDSGHASFVKAHIPGAGFIDLKQAWADTNSDLNFTLPEVDALQQAIRASGISAEHDVVLYSSGHLMWATRAWWLLHYAGHQRIRILNGNLNAWREAGLPLVAGDSAYPPASFAATP
ncbi:MAG: rhodanese-like domain-containing protein, partial [Pseudomonadota bacterium]